jgi:serine/threonine protein kinase/Tfp pilus assembly protein PilF
MSLETGAIINQYKIISSIGKGGMGEVFLAQDTKLDRKVALKILPSEFAEDKDRMNRFVREAKSASALNHPNIITIHEIGESDGTHFIATEFIDGQTLNDYANSSSLSLKSILDIAIQVASALDEAHSAGIVHRDIKPDNVMVRANGLAKILDFGIAKLSAPTESSEEAATAIKSGTSPGMIIGTANYMSPEQAKGQDVDARTDVFSFGVVLYEMIAGHLPFEGKTPMEIIGAIIHKEPKPLGAHTVPPEIAKIIFKTLRKDRNERYQTIRDLLIDLKDVKHELEFQDKLEKTVSPNYQEPKTQMLKATTVDEGQQTATVANRNDSITIRKSNVNKALIGLLAILFISTIGFFGYKYLSPNKQIESIAVMPFVNESGNPDFEYLSDGMTETLISSLSQLPNLNVKARSSVFRYKGREINPQTIGKELNVQALLNGRVVQRGDQLTLSLELIDAQTENVIWSESYNRKQADLVSLQSEIARDVSSKLKSKLSGIDEVKVAKAATTNSEAYQLYLKGRFYWNKRTGESLKQAVDFFNQAIEKDANYVLAYSGLAESYVLFPNYSVAYPLDCMPKAKAAAQRAIELDDSLAETHTALGIYYSDFAYNQPAAEKAFRRAIELNPNYAPAHQQFGIECLTATGRFDEAVAESRRAEEIDPVSPIIAADFGNVLFRARRFDEALAQLNRALTLDPNFWVTRWYLGQAYHAKGQYAEAVAEYQKALASNDNPWVKAQLIRSLVKLGKRDEAVKLLGELQSDAGRRVVSSASLALAYGALGEKDKAFALLDKEIAERNSRPPVFAVNPLWDDLRADPRFADLVRRVELARLD